MAVTTKHTPGHQTFRNELSFESCAVSVAETLLIDGENDAKRLASSFQRNLAHDAAKLLQRAEEIGRGPAPAKARGEG